MSTRKQGLRRQIAGFFFSPHWIEDPTKAIPYLEEIVRQGYYAVVAFVRHQKRTVLDKKVHDAVKAVVKTAHRLGLKVLLDTDPCWWGSSFVEEHPEAALWVIRSIDTTVFDGYFEFPVYFPQMPGQIIFQEISALFLLKGDRYTEIPVSDVDYEWMNFAIPQPGVLIKGKITGSYSGKTVFYVALKTFGLIDVAHPLYLETQESLLEFYADIPLDGFTWDEPGKGMGDLSCFKAGAGFVTFFKELNGYEIRSNLIWLDHLDGTSKAVKVRYDYYRTLCEINLIAQKRHNQYAKKVFKRGLTFGTHQTWSGIPADLAAGVMDYFRLGTTLTAAWTDGGWDNNELRYPAYNYMLAEGLKEESGFLDAYYNDYAMGIPAIENMRFANRFKKLFHINWFNHCFSDFTEDLINFRHEPLNSIAKEEVTNLDNFDRLVRGHFVPYTEVALLYTWEGIATTPKWLSRLFYTSLSNTCLHLVDKGIFARIMSGQSIIKSEINKDGFIIGTSKYKVLVIPFAHAVSGSVYKKILKISENGVPVIFFGPPPEFIAETGKNISVDFAKRVGIKPFTFQEYATAYSEFHSLPNVNEWEPPWVDFFYPLTVINGQKKENREGKILYVKAPTQPLYYMPLPDPREDLVNLIASFREPSIKTFAENTYYRFYLNPQNEEEIVIVAVAKANISSSILVPESYGSGLRPPVKPIYLKVLFKLPKGELIFSGGSWCVVYLKKGQIVETIGDCPDICWNKERS